MCLLSNYSTLLGEEGTFGNQIVQYHFNFNCETHITFISSGFRHLYKKYLFLRTLI